MKLRIALLSAAAPLGLIAGFPATAQEVVTQEDTAQPAIASEEIIVTGAPLGRTADTLTSPVATLSGDELVRRRHTTLGETLAGVPGVSIDNFGGGAARPVIRGQTAPRVHALTDGLELHDASAISPDHAITTEPMLLRRIEVFRGPSALLYGGGIGGAVNLLDDKIPVALPEGGVEGVIEGRVGSGDDERTGIAGLTFGSGNFAFRLEGVAREAGDYAVPSSYGEDRVHGSWNETKTFSIGGAWVGSDGYVGLAYTRLESLYGLPGHSHHYEDCHPHGSTLHCGGHGHEDDDHDHDHDEEPHGDAVPFVDLTSDRFDFRGEFRKPVANIERIRFRAGYTDYRHLEIEPPGEHDHDHDDDHDHDEHETPTTFKNRAYDARIELEHAPVWDGLTGAVGAQYTQSRFNALGAEAFVPESESRHTSVFLLESFEAGALRFDLSIRQDWVKIDWNDIRTGAPMSGSYSPFSLSAGAIGNLGDGASLALTLSRTQRAPNIQELAARGIHLATNTFELGTSTLGNETAHSVELAFRKTRGDTTFSLGVYHLVYDDYIYATTLDQHEDFRLIRYVAADARFTGVEGELRHQITPHLAVSVFGDYVRGRLNDGGGDLPRIPAGRIGLSAETDWNGFSADIEYYHVFKQERIAAFESETPGYDMLNITIAYALPFDKADVEIYLRGANLTDELALSHASFIKDASPLRGRNFVLGIRTTF